MKKIFLLVALFVFVSSAIAGNVSVKTDKRGTFIVAAGKRIAIPDSLKLSFDDMDSVYWLAPATTSDFDIPGGLVWPKLCISENGVISLFLCGEFWKKNGFFGISCVRVKPENAAAVSVTPKKIDRTRETFPGNANFYGVESFSVPYPEKLLSAPAVKIRIIGENETVDSEIKKKNSAASAALLNLYRQIKPEVMKK